MSKTTKTTKYKQKRGYKWPSRPEIFESFSRWMAYPPSLRDPLNQGDFAKLNQVSPDTLSDERERDKF